LATTAFVGAAVTAATGSLGTMSTQNANNVAITGGSVAGITDLAIADGGTGASDAATAFANLKQAATDSATGVVELATNAEAQAGTDTTRVVTPASMKAGLNASGSAPVYACRAWVNFDGTTTTPSIRASGNVTSITDNGTGDYTVNFATAMPDANYGAATVCNEVNSSTTSNFCLSPSRASGSINLITGASGSKTNRQDLGFVSVAIFR
jgi:hypothetical protein